MKQEINSYSDNYGNFSDNLPEWPKFSPLKLIDGKYTLRLLRNNNIDFKSYAEFWMKAYPEIYGGVIHFILNSKNYPKLFGREENFMKNSFAGFIFEDNIKEKIFGGALLYLDRINRTAQGVIMAVLPEYRKKITTGKFLYKFIENYDRFIEDSQAEYAWVAATTNHKTTQILLSHVRYNIRGIIPGMSISALNKDHYVRDNYVYMDKFYNRGYKNISKNMELIPEAKQLWNIIKKSEI